MKMFILFKKIYLNKINISHSFSAIFCDQNYSRNCKLIITQNIQSIQHGLTFININTFKYVIVFHTLSYCLTGLCA